MSTMEPLAQGRQALEAGAWEQARASFEQALGQEETAEALEGLAVSARWLGDASRAIDAGERAFLLHRRRGDDEAAARVAALLSLEVLESRGDAAVASGWLARARDLLRDRPLSPWNAMVDGIEGGLAGMYERDLPRASRLLERAATGARQAGNLDGELLARAQLGLVLVGSGQVTDGMRLLDGAATGAVSGEIADPSSAVAVCCLLTMACLAVRDLERAAQWSRYAMDAAASRGGGTLFDYPRTDRAALLIWQGRWEEADKELRGVIAAATGWSRPAALARLRLADLRRRQGRFAEADAALDELDGGARGGLAPLVSAIRAALALDRGDAGEAARQAEASLRLVPADDLVEQVDALEVLARARAAAGDAHAAHRAAAELVAIAGKLGTRALRAAAELATGAAATASRDPGGARAAFERAGDLFGLADAPLEAAAARLELARALVDTDQPEAAAREATAALAGFRALGAAHQAQRAERLLAEVDPAARGRPDLRLTPREVEVLRLVGQGRSNDEIASGLFLSVRTVERHVANIYAKIGATGRTARATASAFAHRNGII
jgi:DNA-binding NarL/FixJ family response regulator/tetratricopeptide (TPR) repeat protein